MRAGKCYLVYVRFAPSHGLARRVPDAVLAGTGTLCASPYRSDFFVDAQWLVVSFSQKRFSLQMITHLRKAHPVAYG